VPAAHAAQLKELVEGAYEPAEQAVQFTAPAADHEPAAHTAQLVALPGAHVPAAQGVGALVPAVAQAEPLGQGWHALALAAAA
jgi:hypothetical protein